MSEGVGSWGNGYLEIPRDHYLLMCYKIAEGDFNPYHIWFNNKSKALRVKKLISKL
jgi:hypothetical protein